MSNLLVVSISTSVGKTTFCNALVRLLRSRGVSACGFKPFGEFWLYEDADAVFDCLSEGRLFGHDARVHVEAADGEVQEELVAPCYRLMGPSFVLNGLEHSGVSLYGARATVWDGEPQHHYAIVPAQLEVAGLGRFLDGLRSGGASLEEVESFQNLGAFAEIAESAVSSAYGLLAQRYDRLVIESNGFSGLPWSGLVDLDWVFALGTGVAALYEGSEYLRAAQPHLADRPRYLTRHGVREVADHPLYRLFRLVETRKISGLLEPRRTVSILPCRQGELLAQFTAAAEELTAGLL